MSSRSPLSQIVKAIKANDKIALFHHNLIDLDSWACSYGLMLALKSKFPTKHFVFVANEQDIAEQFGWMPYDKSHVVTEIDNTYLAIVGDTASQSKLDFYKEVVKAKQIICFDHHENPIDIKHDIFWSEPDLPASAVQAYQIAVALGVKFTPEIAFNMILGLLTDTGSFSYSLADTRPVWPFAELLGHVKNDQMKFFWDNIKRKTADDLKVQQFFLENVKYDGRVDYVFISQKDADKFGRASYHAQVNTIGNIDKFPMWATFAQRSKDGKSILEVSLRSNGPDVAKVAIAIGGGGHAQAAGAVVPFTNDAVQKIVDQLNKL